MPIRKRGESYQIDFRTAEGNRIRRNFATKEEAEEALAALTPNPQQRAAARALRRRQRSTRSKGSRPTSGEPSSPSVVTSIQAESKAVTWPKYASDSATKPTPPSK